MNAPAILAARSFVIPGVAVLMWLELLGAACVVLAVTAALAGWQHRRAAPTPSVGRVRARRLTQDDLVRMLADVDALSRRAVLAATTARDAESAVAAAHARCRATQRIREAAWREYDAAQRAYVGVLYGPVTGDEVWPLASTSGAWPVLVAGGAEPPAQAPVEPPAGVALTTAATALVLARPPADRPTRYDDRQVGYGDQDPDHRDARSGLANHDPGSRNDPGLQNDVARAALAAHRRGDISVEQLREVFRRFSGWDRRHERHEREVLRRRAAEREAHHRYDAAAAAERAAYHAAEVAAVAARAWADEAAEAATEARLARVFVNECLLRTPAGRRLLRARR